MARESFLNRLLGFGYRTGEERRQDQEKRTRSASRPKYQRGRSKLRLENQFPPLKNVIGAGQEQTGVKDLVWNISLFRNSRKIKPERVLKFYEPNPRSEEDDPSIIIPSEVVDREIKKWESYLVAYVVGKRPHFPALKNSLEVQWRLKCSFQMHSLPEGFFLFKFFDKTDRLRVRDEGPWCFFGRPLVIREWNQGIVLKKDQFNSLPIWVRLLDLDFRLWDNEAIGRITSVIGKPKFLDDQTSNRERLAYARACVEINPQCNFLRNVRILIGTQWIRQQVHYEWIPYVCRACNCFDHSDIHCSYNGAISHSPNEEILGEWMQVGSQRNNGKAATKEAGVLSENVAQVISNSNPKAGLEGKSNALHEKAVSFLKDKTGLSNGFELLQHESTVCLEAGLLEYAGTSTSGKEMQPKDDFVQVFSEPVDIDSSRDVSSVPETMFLGALSSPDSDEDLLEVHHEDHPKDHFIKSRDFNEPNNKKTLIQGVLGKNIEKQVFSVLTNLNNEDDMEYVRDEGVLDKNIEKEVLAALINSNHENGTELVRDKGDGDFANKVGRREVLSKDGSEWVSEVEGLEAVPPGFDVVLEETLDENSIETTVHISTETSESDEEDIGFSSARARMIREKLGINFPGKGNADKAFADFVRKRQMEIENVRKKSVVPDVSIKLRKQVGKRGFSFMRDSRRKKKS